MYIYICKYIYIWALVNSKFMPVGVHSIVLWVHADMNEWFMTCSVYGGSRAQYFRTHRGETFARVAIVVWWQGFIWPWFRLFSRFIFVGATPSISNSVDRSSFGISIYLEDEDSSFRWLPVWLGDCWPSHTGSGASWLVQDEKKQACYH